RGQGSASVAAEACPPIVETCGKQARPLVLIYFDRVTTTSSLPTELQLRHDRRLLSVALALMLVPAIWYVRTDLALYAHDWPRLQERLLTRAGLVAISIAGLWFVRFVQTRAEFSRLAFGVGLATATVLITLNILRPAGSSLPLRSPLFHLMLMYGLLPNRLWRQIGPPLLLSGALIVLRETWLTGVTPDADVRGDELILLVVNAVGILLLRHRLKLERDVDLAWAAEHEARLVSEQTLRELHTLHGIIPICAHCKQVRTELGQWQQIEQYVAAHTDANFSHGICPDCMKKHYPKLA